MGGSVAVKPDLATPTGIPGAVAHGALPTSADAIGDPYIEGHGHCAKGGPGCFLTPAQRAALIQGYQRRLLAAQQAFGDALVEVRFDELIKKDDDLPLWIGLLVDVIGTLAVSGVSIGLKLAKSASEADLEAMLTVGPMPDPSKASLRELVHNVDPGSAEAVAKFGVEQVKPALKASPRDPEKAVKLDYIAELQRASQMAWQRQAEGPPSVASDGELIVLYRSFSADNGHSAPEYKAAIEDKIKRFMASPVSRIGRVHTDSKKDVDVADRGTEGMVLRDTKVVWVQHHDHLPPTLYYEKRDAMDTNNDYTRDHLELTPLAAEASFHLTTPVEPEFVETAIARHKETWGGDPEVYDIDGLPAPWANARPAPAPLPADNKVAPSGLDLPALPMGPA